jgi:hypothetical protein
VVAWVNNEFKFSDASLDEEPLTAAAKANQFADGFVELSDEWAFKFTDEINCAESSASCVGLVLAAASSCERASVDFIVHSEAQTFRRVARMAELSRVGDLQIGTVSLNLTGYEWRTAGVEGVQCLAPTAQSISQYKGYVTSNLRVNFAVPTGLTQLGKDFAYGWTDTAECNQLFMTCWTLDIASARPCSAIAGNFAIVSKSGERLSTISSTRNVVDKSMKLEALQFGTSAPLDSDEILIEPISFRCLEGPVDERAEANNSRALIPDYLCVDGRCNATANEFTLPEFSSEFQEESPLWPSGAFEYSGGGYPVLCNDGTTSYAGGKQGACSWHGGIAR